MISQAFAPAAYARSPSVSQSAIFHASPTSSKVTVRVSAALVSSASVYLPRYLHPLRPALVSARDRAQHHVQRRDRALLQASGRARTLAERAAHEEQRDGRGVSDVQRSSRAQRRCRAARGRGRPRSCCRARSARRRSTSQRRWRWRARSGPRRTRTSCTSAARSRTQTLTRAFQCRVYHLYVRPGFVALERSVMSIMWTCSMYSAGY